MRHAVILLALLLTACGKKVYSEERYEEGRVTRIHFIPEHTDTTISIDADGNTSFDYDTIPDKYIMEFLCDEHGEEFRVSNSTARRLYNELRQGDRVIITYRQIDRVKEKDGVEVERHFAGWDFIDAKKFDPNGPIEQ